VAPSLLFVAWAGPGGEVAPEPEPGLGDVAPPWAAWTLAAALATVCVTLVGAVAAAPVAGVGCEDPPHALTAAHDSSTASGAAAAVLARCGLWDWWVGVGTDFSSL
jgi:hypothetical protein